MKLSNQAASCIMIALQKGILEQTDITDILQNFDFVKGPEVKRWGGQGELIVDNPPNLQMSVTETEVK